VIEDKIFFNVGNLNKFNSLICLPGYSNTQINGTEQEEEKYKMIIQLYFAILKYESLSSYFAKLDCKYILPLALTNNSDHYDESVDVQILISKEVICNEIPEPDDYSIEIIAEVVDQFYMPVSTLEIKSFDNYHKIQAPSSKISYPFQNNDIDNARDLYLKKINQLFCYEYYDDNSDYNVVSYSQPFIKPHENIYFPTFIVLDTKPDKIKYRISSKFSPKIIEGQIHD